MILPSWYPVKNASCNVSRRRNLSETLFVWRNNLPYMKHLPEDFSVFSVSVLRTRHNNHWKLIYVSRTIPSSQYETNLWSTHVNIDGLTEPIRRCFQNRGVCLKAFPSFPSPSPHFHFLALVSFLARPKPRIPFLRLSLLRNQTETLSTQATFFVPKPHGNACYAGYPICCRTIVTYD